MYQLTIKQAADIKGVSAQTLYNIMYDEQRRAEIFPSATKLGNMWLLDPDEVEHWKAQKGTPCEWNGVKYDTVSDAADALGITQGTMSARIKKGYTCDEDMKTSQVPCEWNGVKYNSIAEAASALGISATAFLNRRRRGYTCDEDIKPSRWKKK